MKNQEKPGPQVPPLEQPDRSEPKREEPGTHPGREQPQTPPPPNPAAPPQPPHEVPDRDITRTPPNPQARPEQPLAERIKEQDREDVQERSPELYPDQVEQR